MSQMYPETEEHKQAAADGEASHEVAELLIHKAARAGVGRALNVGDTASNGVVITPEMYEGAELYADDVTTVMHRTRIYDGATMGVEDRVFAPSIHELSYGTNDAHIFDRQGKALYIWDYKFGYLVVEPFENWQSINYVSGLLDRYGVDGIEDQELDIVIRIVQPRASHRNGPIREWRVKASELRGYFNILAANARKALSSAAELKTGPHCRFCQARHACPAALEAGVGLYEVSMAPIPVDLSPEALGLQLRIVTRAIEQLKALESGYQEQVKSLIKTGSVVPFWGVEPSYGRETWARPLEEVFAFGDLLGHDLRKSAAITPNQAVKLGIDRDVIKPYCEKPKTGLKLVPDNGSKAREVFSK